MNWNQKRKEVRPQNVNADHDGLSLRLYDRGEPHRHRRGVKIEENYLIPKITKSFFFGFCCHVVCPRTSHLHVDATRFNRLWRQMSVNIWEKTHFYEKEEEEEEEYYMSFFGCSFSIPLAGLSILMALPLFDRAYASFKILFVISCTCGLRLLPLHSQLRP